MEAYMADPLVGPGLRALQAQQRGGGGAPPPAELAAAMRDIMATGTPDQGKIERYLRDPAVGPLLKRAMAGGGGGGGGEAWGGTYGAGPEKGDFNSYSSV
jgi:hypothetical protein